MSIYPRTTFAEVAAGGKLFVVAKPYRRSDRPARPWCVEYRDPLTDKRQKRSFRTEREAWAFYNRVTDDREGLRCGSLTRRQVLVGAGGLMMLDDAVTKYEQHRRDRGLTASNTKAAVATIRAFLASTAWRTVREITAGPLETWLATFKGNTARKYFSDIRAWVTWLVKTDRLPENPIASVKMPEASEPMRKRAFSDEEFAALISCEKIRPHRRLWYWLSGRLGLRHLEIGRLLWQHLDLDHATLRLPGSRTKNRRDATLPIPSSLVRVLREMQQAPATPVVRIKCKPCEATWHADLQYAGIAFETGNGRAVLSSLRKTYATHLARKGVDLRTAQRLMRHGNVNLTAKIYTEVLESEMKEAVEKLA